MNENPRILVASPIFDGMKYCMDKFVERIKSLSYNNYDILLVDNSKTSSFCKEIADKYSVNIIHLSMDDFNMEKIIQSRNKILDYAINESYNYVLMMDCDVIPPVDIIDRLLLHEKDIVSGLYYSLLNIYGKQEYRAVAWKGATDEEFQKVKLMFSPGIIKSRDNLRRHLTDEEIESEELQEVIIPSAGCMLISRNVFQNVRYGLLDVSGYDTSDDIFFCKKAREAGFKLYCDPTVECEHLIYGKFKNDGENFIHPAYQ